MSIDVVTFGCRLNAYESEAIKARAQSAGLSNAIVVNTCAVTAEAVRQSRQQIRKLKRERPDAFLIVTGCAAQTEPETYSAMAEVDRVLGNEEKLDAKHYAPDFLRGAERVLVNDIMAVKETAAQLLTDGMDPFAGKARAVLQVQNGCDHRCTFCIIPFGRGNSRSVGAGEVVAEARRLAEAGFKELVLSGVDLTSYGADLPGQPKLGQLIAQILKHVPELPRLRLSSIDSIEIDETILRLVAEEERFMPYFHISVQAGDDLILKRMKRRHLRQHTIDFCREIRALRPEAAFGADLIAGFPTETDEMFQNTLDLVEEAALTYLHVFPFSPRTGTPAARMPQLPREIIKERAKRLRAKGDAVLAERFLSLSGSVQSILMETGHLGRTPCFAPVAMNGVPGDIVRARLTSCDGRLTGLPEAREAA
jgi:threonylcarbamoyladenosine tRNA methylthiotransferase MtaB